MTETAFYNFVSKYNSRVPVSAPPVTAQKEKRILIVDDDSFIRKMLRMVLKDAGFKEMFEADCAEAAIRMLDSHEFDLVISDINMPGKSGLEFAKLIRSGKTSACCSGVNAI